MAHPHTDAPSEERVRALVRSARFARFVMWSAGVLLVVLATLTVVAWLSLRGATAAPSTLPLLVVAGFAVGIFALFAIVLAGYVETPAGADTDLELVSARTMDTFEEIGRALDPSPPPRSPLGPRPFRTSDILRYALIFAAMGLFAWAAVAANDMLGTDRSLERVLAGAQAALPPVLAILALLLFAVVRSGYVLGRLAGAGPPAPPADRHPRRL